MRRPDFLLALAFTGGLTAPSAAQTAAMTATTKAVELKVEGVTSAAELGGRKARAGYEFVIVDTSWKNIIPLRQPEQPSANRSGGLGGLARNPGAPPPDPNAGPISTPYMVPEVQTFLWLLTDGRFADTVDLDAQNAVPNHLNNGFGVAKFGDVLRGTLVFEAPANAKYRALQFFDNENGGALIPLRGMKPAVPPPAGPTRENEVVQLAVSEAGFGPAGRQAPAGLRYYAVTVRGTSKSPKDIVRLPLGQIVFLQTDRGCVAQPETDVAGLSRPFTEIASFVPGEPNEGQLVFLVPEDTKNARVLITPSGRGQLILPTAPDAAPSWPAPVQTIEDGSTMKVLILPRPARPANLPAAAAGREQFLLDVVAQNTARQGIELQGAQQLRLVNPGGGFIEPSPLSNQLACRLGDVGVIPAGQARRFLLVYDVPAGMAKKLQYRGFEKDEVVVDLK
jgi:hypothetical protein